MADTEPQPSDCAAAGDGRHGPGSVRPGAIIVIVAGSAIAVYAERATILSGVAAFRQANLGWVVAGFAAECVSMVAFALIAALHRAGLRSSDAVGAVLLYRIITFKILVTLG